MESDNDKTRTHIVLTKGTMVSHYRIMEKIGAGGMGEVYLAEDTELDRKVALKFLPSHLCQDEDCRKRFKREAQAAAKLDHPNIVPVYEVGDFNGRPFFAMGHIDGRSLHSEIKRAKLTAEDAIRYATGLCEGIQKAHESGVVHRDIKPSNIIIDRDGRPRIVDFGLAAVSDKNRLTKTGSTLGTVGYMSPEQVEGRRVDHRSDLFSLGVVIYEMLTGRRPFEGDNDAAVVRSITGDMPEPIARYKSGTSAELQRIVDKALSKDPSTRYQHADEIAADLRRLSSGAAPPKRRRLAVAASVAILLIIAAALLTWRPWKRSSLPGEKHRIMLAVLPFENLGDPEDDYFADGITEEVISRLAGVRELGVIARTSISRYKGSDKPITQIAAELGVAYVLEGTIRWEKNPEGNDLVRITPQLIQASDATHLWAGNYDRELSQIFAVQTDIAINIIQELRVSLLADEGDRIEKPLTGNLEAYQFYLRARKSLDESSNMKRHIETGIRYLDSALDRDPAFPLAIAELSIAHARMYHHYFDHSDERGKAAFDAASRALELDPDLPEAYFAMGCYHYWVRREYSQAISSLESALSLKPNDSRIMTVLGLVERRSGHFEEGLGHLLQAMSLNPHDAGVAWEIADTYSTLRRYELADEYCWVSLQIEPNAGDPQIVMVRNEWLWRGSADNTRDLVDTALEKHSGLILEPFSQRVYEGNYQSAVEWCDTLPHGRTYHGTYIYSADQLKGWAFWLEGAFDSARIHFEAATAELEERLKDPASAPRVYSELGIVNAFMGSKDEAVRYARRGVELMPVSKDAVRGPERLADLALTLTIVGQKDEAVSLIDSLLRIPCELSIPLMQLDKRWSPLYENPGFRALVKKYGRLDGT